MNVDLAEMNSAVMGLDEISSVLNNVTLVEKLVFSGVTKEEVRTAIIYCNSTEELDKWLESVLKHWVQEQDLNTVSWDVHRKEKIVRRNLLRMFENSNLLTNNNYLELQRWAQSTGSQYEA